MKSIIFIFCLILLSSLPALANDVWLIDAFDRSQELFRKFEQEEAQAMVAIDPKVKAYFDVRFPFDEANRKMSRYVFILQLQDNPQAIDWSNPYFWGDLSTRESMELANKDNTFKSLQEENKALMEVFRRAEEAIALRNNIYNSHSAEFSLKEATLHRELMSLRDEISAKMANKSQERTD